MMYSDKKNSEKDTESEELINWTDNNCHVLWNVKKVIKTLNNKSKQLSADQFSQKGRQYILDINGPFLDSYGVYDEEKGGGSQNAPLHFSCIQKIFKLTIHKSYWLSLKVFFQRFLRFFYQKFV